MKQFNSLRGRDPTPQILYGHFAGEFKEFWITREPFEYIWEDERENAPFLENFYD